MKKLRANAFVKLMAALLVIALLTGCAYYGVFGVAFSVIGADDWAGAVLNMAMGQQTQNVINYYRLTEDYGDVKEADRPDWVKEELAMYEAMFDPETTNFRYALYVDEEQVFGNYKGEAYLARSYDWEQTFVGTELDRQRLSAYENGVAYDYENDVYLPAQGYNRYPVPEDQKLQKKYVTYDESGYLYNADDEMIARIENYSDLMWHLSYSESAEEMSFVIDGITYYPIGSDEGFPVQFAYKDQYDRIYDEDLNFIMYLADYVDMADYGTMVSPTPRPYVEATPSQVVTPATVGNFDIKPKVVALPKEFTEQDYKKLYDKCWEEYSARGYIPEEMAVNDAYHELYMRVLQYDLEKRDNMDAAMLFGVGGLVLLVILLYLAGKRDEEDNCVPAGLGRLPWDVWFVLMCCLAVAAVGTVWVAVQFMIEAFYYNYMVGSELSMDSDLIDLIIKGCVAAGAFCIACAVGGLHSLAARVKVKGWWKQCLCWKAVVWCWKWCVKLVKWCWRLWLRIWRGLKKGIGSIPLIWKAVVVLGVVCIVEIVFCCMIYSPMGVIGILLSILKFLVCVIVCLMLKRLQQGARTIADGDLNHRIDTKNMFGDFKEHAECLNRIGDGLSHSVDAQLRSERMKTELITNVSHDLKTPLTSIVNYVDLLKKEELEGTAAEYVEVLDRQSARLKKLTEDLVEASKASSGSLNVTVERVSLTELLEQAQAEYAVRLGEIGLQSIVRQPDGEVTVWADGKYVWRILDNLLSNVRKYAMPNTRVYLEVRKDGDMAVLSVKNMSRESLNISAEELMERFVRGDSSRNTEGSGLGLSIAQSLAKLMGGEVKITIDGDLFKADVELPMAK